MLKFLAHDTANDVALIQTAFGFQVRYGLHMSDRTKDIREALDEFAKCQRHALADEISRAHN